MWKGIVGKFVDVAGLQSHVDGLVFTGWTPQFVVVHNTSAPDLATYAGWRAHPERHGNWTPEQWARNLESYYQGQHPPWSGGPHAFVCPDGILLFTPLTTPGTHSPAWNSRTWGIETVGEFMRDPFDNGTRDNLVATLATLHARLGLHPGDYKFGVRGIHFHKEDPVTTHKSCPGDHMVKAELVRAVEVRMMSMHPGDHIEIPARVQAAPTTDLTVEQMTSVAWLQKALSELGANLAVDGAPGPRTRQATAEFQRTHALTVDGVAGPVTRLAIVRALAASPGNAGAAA